MSESLQSLLRRAAAAIETPGDLTADELSHVAEDLAERANVLDAQPQGESPAQGAHNWLADYNLGWRIIDLESDNLDLVADIDPNNIAADLGKDPSEIALLMAAAPEMAAALRSVLTLLEQGQPLDLEHDGEWIRAALRKAGAL